MAKIKSRYSSFILIALIILLTLTSVFWPKDEFQLIKDRLINNPQDYEAHLLLADKFLMNNQFTEAEKELLLAQKIEEQDNSRVLGIWQKKHYADPQDIYHLITAWEKIVLQKPNYRDGWLQLAFLHYKIYEDEKAKESLKKALELDPNYEPTRALEKIIFGV